MAIEQRLEMTKGDTFSFIVEVEDYDGDFDEIIFSCKNLPFSKEYVFQKTLSDGITKLDAAKYRVRIAPEDTQALDLREYHYDLQVKIHDDENDRDDVYTVMKGKLAITYEVTEEE